MLAVIAAIIFFVAFILRVTSTATGVALVTAIFVVFPFRTGAPLEQEVATAAVYLVIGVAIGTLLSGVGERATRVRPVVTTQAAVRQDYQDLG